MINSLPNLLFFVSLSIAIAGQTDFDGVPVSQRATSQITVSNSGDRVLTISALNTIAVPFSIMSDTCSGQTQSPSGECTMQQDVTPTQVSSVSAVLRIPANAVSSPDTVTFSATGMAEQACEFDCLTGNGDTQRNALTYNDLMQANSNSLIDYSHYSLPAYAQNPRHRLTGVLSLNITPGTLIEQGTNLASAYINPNSLPPFSFSFVQYGTHVLPTQRQVVNTGHTAWEWVLLPGRAWNENADNGYSRVALPFALQEINANCTHNGVLTLLFKDDGSVSDVAYQIAQETCEYFKYNLHGKVAAEFSPGAVEGAQQIINDYLAELANRLTVKPLSALAVDYPTANIVLSAIGSDQTATHLSAYGLLYNGVHYQGECQTRQGDYPFCAVMALPSYSTAKTLVAGLAVMRAEQKYGGSQQSLRVSNWVSQCDDPHWQDVTLLNTLDMATGNYNSALDSVDEGAQKTFSDFFLVATHAAKINHSCAYSRNAAPGTEFVYHTSDTYIVSSMLQQYHQQHAGAQADYFDDLVVNDIYKPLQLSPLTYASKRTYDARSQVWGGYGLTLQGDDFVKLGRFLAQHNGQINGQVLLDRNLLDDALQRTANSGLNAGVGSRYQHSVWAFDLHTSTQLGCKAPTWVPYMSGFGGIGVVMLPNDMVYYYVSDNKEYGFSKTVKELQKISPVCNQ